MSCIKNDEVIVNGVESVKTSQQLVGWDIFVTDVACKKVELD